MALHVLGLVGMRGTLLLLVIVVGAGCNASETIDDRCLSTFTGVDGSRATWTMTQTLDEATCAIDVRRDVVLHVGAYVPGGYAMVPADPQIAIVSMFLQPQVAPTGCAEYDHILFSDDVVVDGVSTRAHMEWELLLLDRDGDFEISGTFAGDVPGVCTFAGTIDGHYARD